MRGCMYASLLYIGTLVLELNEARNNIININQVDIAFEGML